MKQYIVDAFTDKLFSGNPAAVVVSKEWLPAKIMQNIAMENNLSETAFTVKETNGYRLRWFTPQSEVDLCGHATLATAYVILRFYEPGLETITFNTRSGPLKIEKNGMILTMDFPAFTPRPITVSEELHAALGGVWPVEAYQDEDIVCVVDSEDVVRSIQPDLAVIHSLDAQCLHVTARGNEYDCVTRSFAPRIGVAEDPVCGRGHCHVVPIWAEKLGKDEVTAFQASPRTGVLYCDNAGGRIFISGSAVLFSKGSLYLDE